MQSFLVQSRGTEAPDSGWGMDPGWGMDQAAAVTAKHCDQDIFFCFPQGDKPQLVHSPRQQDVA